MPASECLTMDGKIGNTVSTQVKRVSVVIPAFNEAQRLPASVKRIEQYVKDLEAQERPAFRICEVVLVDDGSSDDTAGVARGFQQSFGVLRVIALPENHGKGAAVRSGMLSATGDIALFTDADLSAPIDEMPKLINALETADVAIGSRAIDRSLIESRQSRLRELAGITFNCLVRAFTGVHLKDTQCGFKAFVLPQARAVFELQRVEGFGFDPEILFLANRLGLQTREVPVRWAHDPRTKVNVFRDSLKMALDLVRIRLDWFIGRYKPSAERRSIRPRDSRKRAGIPVPGSPVERASNT